MKPFDLEAAKRGDPVITRDGKKVRIVCFDVKGSRPVVGLVDYEDFEACYSFYADGLSLSDEYELELFMAPKKVTKWSFLKIGSPFFAGYEPVFDTRNEAEAALASCERDDVVVVKGEWEE